MPIFRALPVTPSFCLTSRISLRKAQQHRATQVLHTRLDCFHFISSKPAVIFLTFDHPSTVPVFYFLADYHRFTMSRVVFVRIIFICILLCTQVSPSHSATCYETWSRCTQWSSFLTGIAWQTCSGYCDRCRGYSSGGTCVKVRASCSSTGYAYQCQCVGSRRPGFKAPWYCVFGVREIHTRKGISVQKA